jgi:hypothetical protein
MNLTNKILTKLLNNVMNEYISMTRRTLKLLDVKYEKADLNAIVSKCTYLSTKERTALLKLLL